MMYRSGWQALSGPQVWILAILLLGGSELKGQCLDDKFASWSGDGLNCLVGGNVDVNDLSIFFVSNWQLDKRSVVYLRHEDQAFSGVLINNSSSDGIPYILTASHTIWKQSHVDDLRIIFGYENPAGGAGIPSESFELNGAEIVAISYEYDFALLKLMHKPPVSAMPVFAGWDRSGAPPSDVVVIHHPMNDYKKISRKVGLILTGYGMSPYFSHEYKNKSIYSPNSYWEVSDWTNGVIQPGSSGSPLFNSNFKVTGVNSHGIYFNNCLSTVFSGDINWFTKFSTIWDPPLGSSSEKLRPHLDPIGTNPVLLDRYIPTCADGYDGFEPNNSLATSVRTFRTLEATPWTCDRLCPISQAGDKDYFKLDCNTSGTLSMVLYMTNLGTENYNLSLLNQNGNLVASNYQGVGANEAFAHTLTPGTYYLKVEGATSNDFSCTDYQLVASWVPSPCPVTAAPNAISPGSVNLPATPVNTTYPTLTWSPFTGANGYQIDILSGTSTIYTQCVTSGTSLLVPPGTLDWGTLYSWTVTALNNGCGSCESPPSAALFFQTAPAPASFCSGLTSLTATSGTVTDGSGTADYQDNSYCEWQISIPGATGIRWDFTDFELGDGNDYVVLFDGPDDTSPVLGVFYQAKSPPLNITSTGPDLFVRFVADQGFTAAGWSADYQAIFPQIQGVSYWLDQDVANVTYLPLGPGNPYVWNVSLPINKTPGDHVLHLRTKDQQGFWSSVWSRDIHVQGAIEEIAFYFNNMGQPDIIVPAGGDQTIVLDSLMATGQPAGRYDLSIRAKEVDGAYSSVSTQEIHVQGAVEEIEFYFDDLGQPDIVIPAGGDQTIVLDSLMATGQPANQYDLSIRARETDRTYSSVLTREIHVQDSVSRVAVWSGEADGPQQQFGPYQDIEISIDTSWTTATSKGDRALYLQVLGASGRHSSVISIDFHHTSQLAGLRLSTLSDPTETIISLGSVDDTTLTIPFDAGYLSGGEQTLLLKTTDHSGTPSSILTRTFEHLGGGNVMKQIRVWFDGINQGANQVILSPGKAITSLFQLPVDTLSSGPHDLYLQFMDSAGRWSQVLRDSFAKQIVPWASFSASDTQFCAGDPVAFTNTSVNALIYLWNFGEGTTSVLPSPVHTYQESGSYTVSLIAYLPGTGLSDTLTRTAYIEVFKPEVNIVVSDPFFCEGDSTQLSGAGALSYLWSSQGSISDTVGSSIWASPEASTSVRVIGVDSLGCVDTASIGLTVYPLPAAPLLTTSADTICQGASATVGTSGVYASYLWSNGASGSSIQVSEPGIYFLQGESIEGCLSPVSNIISIDTFPAVAIPDILVVGDSVACEGETVLLTAAGGGSYLWSNGAATDSLTVTQSGMYQVKSISADGCESDWSGTQEVIIYETPKVPVISQVGDSLVASTLTTGYQWFRNGGILSGENNQTIKPQQSGIYRVVAVENGCLSDTSAEYVFTVSSLESFQQAGFRIYPNPSNGRFTLQAGPHSPLVNKIEVYDARGRIIWRQEDLLFQVMQIPIDLGSVPEGGYFLQLSTDTDELRQKLTVFH